MTSVPEAVRSQRKLDSEKLQELVVRQQEQLNDTRQVTRRLEGQLNCLLLLVRKAWTGDMEASDQVAQVVGVPPPHWAIVGDGDSQRGSEDGDRRWRSETDDASHLLYFRERLGHLNSVLSHHSALMNGFGRQLSLRPPRPLSGAAQHDRPLRLRRSSSASSLSRAAEFHGELVRGAATTGQDFVIPPQPRPGHVFDAAGVAGQPAPPPAAGQRAADEARARPRSSRSQTPNSPFTGTGVRHDSGRPMKFETTRPLPPRPSSRPSSGKPPTSGSARRPTRRPLAIDELSHGESRVHDMQRQFEATVLDLQRRLGLDENGLVM